MNKYNEIMARVAVSEETKRRILENLQTAQPEPAKIARFPNAKRYIAVAACFAVALLGVLAVTLFGRPPQTVEPIPGAYRPAARRWNTKAQGRSPAPRGSGSRI